MITTEVAIITINNKITEEEGTTSTIVEEGVEEGVSIKISSRVNISNKAEIMETRAEEIIDMTIPGTVIEVVGVVVVVVAVVEVVVIELSVCPNQMLLNYLQPNTNVFF